MNTVTLRKQIDQIDAEILELLIHRRQLSKQLLANKQSIGQAPQDVARESEILDLLKQRNCGRYPNSVLEQIYEAIFRMSRGNL